MATDPDPVRESAAQPPLTFTYRNHRGETAVRRVVPIRVWYGHTDWHPDPQWLMDAHDLDRGEVRTFALADMVAGPGEVVVRLPQVTPGAQLLPGADDVRELVSGEVVGRSLAPGLPLYADYVGVWPGGQRWLAPAEARDRAAQLLAVADAVERTPPGRCRCCTGGWVADQNWQPEEHERGNERAPGSGLIPCGACNHGGWDAPWPPADADAAERATSPAEPTEHPAGGAA
jgi:hypothetical protein